MAFWVVGVPSFGVSGLRAFILQSSEVVNFAGPKVRACSGPRS